LPKKVKLYRQIWVDVVNEYFDLMNEFSEKLVMPYMQIFYEYNHLLDKNYSVKEIKYKEKFLELHNHCTDLVGKYMEILYEHSFEMILNKPLVTEKYSSIQFYLDKFSDRFRYHLVSLSIFSLLIYILYCLNINYWNWF
jgi:hypothetical protein